GISGAMDLLAAIRSSRSNKASGVFAAVNGKATVSMAVEAGANFVLGKPVQDKPLRGILDIALLRMEREHRRYFRHAVDVPIQLSCYTGSTFAGKIMNVSEGGLALNLFRFGPVERVVRVE